MKAGHPSGFVRLSEGASPRRAVLLVDPEFEGPVRSLELLADDAAWRSAPGPGRPGRGRAASQVLDLPGRPERVHLRPLRHGGWWAPLWGTRIWGPGRAWRELSASGRLRKAGAPVPRPLLAVAVAASPGWQAAVGHVHLESHQDGLAWLREIPSDQALARGAAAAGRAVRRFHDSGGRHPDLHAGNLLIERGTPDAVHVVDLDGVRVGAPPSPRQRMAELMRLERSLRKHGLPTRGGDRVRAAFFGGYCGRDRALRRALRAWQPLERLKAWPHTWRYPAAR